MFSYILFFLLAVYILLNLVIFGVALVFMPVSIALWYLFFGCLIVIKNFFIDPWL